MLSEENSKLIHDLRARSHHLNPVVIVGDKGLSKPVMKEISIALDAHELVKIRLNVGDRKERNAMLRSICEKTRSIAVNQIGKIIVIYREIEEHTK